MTFPVWLFYKESGSALNYQSSPTGTINVERLLQGHDKFWLSPIHKDQLKKKKIILADWSAFFWSKKKLDLVIIKLKELLDNDFELYLSIQDQLIPVTATSLSILYSKDDRSLMRPSDLQTMSLALNTSNEKICVLDDYWLSVLLDEEVAKRPRVLRIDYFTQYFTQSEKSEEMLPLLSQAKPNVEVFEHDHKFKLTELETEVQEWKSLNSIKERSCFDVFELNNQRFSDFNGKALSILSKRISNLDCGNFFINKLSNSDFETLKQFFVECNKLEVLKLNKINSERLNALLQVVSSLVELNLSEPYRLNSESKFSEDIEPIQFISIPERCLNRLRIVDLSRRTISSRRLFQLMKIAPELDEINLSQCNVISELAPVSPKGVNKLRKIGLAKSTITAETLIELLRCSPELEELTLSNYPHIAKLFSLLQFPLPALRIIDLSYCDASSDLPKLADLAPGLKTIHLRSTKMNNNLFSQLAPLMQGLDKIDLNGCLFVGDDLVLEYHLNKVTELELSNSNINSKSLVALLKAAPSLKRLELAYCSCVADIIRLPKNHLRELKHLGLSSSEITIESLNLMLQAAPHLKSINLCDTNIDPEFIDTLKAAFPRLEIRYTFRKSLSKFYYAAPPIKDAKSESVKASNQAVAGSLEDSLLTEPSVSRSNALDRNKTEEADTQDQNASTQENTLFTDPTIFRSNAPGRKESMDADTRDQNASFQTQRIFYPLADAPIPEPNDYRISVYSSLYIKQERCSIQNAFELGNPLDLELKECERPPELLSELIKDGHTCYSGYAQLNLTHQWQALPSLSCNEVLLSLQTQPDTTDIKLAYSEKTNLYYIKSTSVTSPQSLSLKYTVGLPITTPKPLPESITQLASFCRSFGSGALTKQSGNGTDYLDAMYQEKKGACRHRALVFKDQMAKLYPEIPVRIITNQCHAFVEVQVDNDWQACDLGGYPSTLSIDETFRENWDNVEEIEEKLALNKKRPNDSDSVVLDSVMLQQCATWLREHKPTAAKIYYQRCASGLDEAGISTTIQKRLIECFTSEEQLGLRYQFEKYCRDTQKPFFYVHSPENLICASPRMKVVDGLGVLQKGPSGPLYDFLTNNPTGVLLVNYSAFSSEDLVRWNALLDKHRSVDNVAVPQHQIVIGLWNKEAESTPGCDFFSRFDLVESCPIEKELLTNILLPTPREAFADNPQEITVELHHSVDWRSKLMGGFVSRDGHWCFEEGLLSKAFKTLETDGTLCISNGLWSDPEFCHFWQELQHNGSLSTPAGIIRCPHPLILSRSEGYHWPVLSEHLKNSAEPPMEPYTVLNPGTLSSLFGQYVVSNGNLEKTSGEITRASLRQPKLLTVYVTHTLTEDSWAQILDEAQNAGVVICTYCAPGVTLPEALSNQMLEQTVATEEELSNWPSYGIIHSDDMDVTLARCLAVNPERLLIQCTDLTPADLLSRIDASLVSNKEAPMRLEFKETISALNKALKGGREVVLYGAMSPELAYALAPLFLKRTPGLYYVGEDISIHAYLPHHLRHKVTASEKREILKQIQPTIPQSLEDLIDHNVPLVQLLARAQAIQRDALSTQGDEAWVGLHSIALKNLDPGAFDPSQQDKETVAQWVKQRKEGIKHILATSPYVFISGLSGVGKSTFVTQELLEPGETLYQGEDKLLQWAQDSTSDLKLLFIDEANLSNESWSQFEGLWHKPPSILIKGQLYELDETHKVVFAGNPLSYGDERQLPPLFARHGNAQLFEVIPSQVLYERVLAPLFHDTALAAQATYLSQTILDVYRFLCLCSEKDVLISPRELEMMALSTLAYCDKNKTVEPKRVVKHMAFELAKSLVPEAQSNAFARQFKPFTDLPISTELDTLEYLITPSRKKSIEWLDHFLSVREARDTGQSRGQRYGGLGGLILEGEPGIGKSELVTTLLVHKGYHELHDYEAPASHAKCFYRMPVSMSLTEKEKLLRKAFNEGLVVIIDEINSSPMMERLLNALLMGTTPEGERPQRPGFMIIGTQNPTTMAGRRAASTALMRRTMQLTLSSYTIEEMQQILIKKGVEPEVGAQLVLAYDTQRKHALTNHLNPVPTFRDLLRIADRYNIRTKVKSTVEELSDAVTTNVQQQAQNELTPQVLKILNDLTDKVEMNNSNSHRDVIEEQFKKLCCTVCKNKRPLSGFFKEITDPAQNLIQEVVKNKVLFNFLVKEHEHLTTSEARTIALADLMQKHSSPTTEIEDLKFPKPSSPY